MALINFGLLDGSLYITAAHCQECMAYKNRSSRLKNIFWKIFNLKDAMCQTQIKINLICYTLNIYIYTGESNS